MSKLTTLRCIQRHRPGTLLRRSLQEDTKRNFDEDRVAGDFTCTLGEYCRDLQQQTNFTFTCNGELGGVVTFKETYNEEVCWNDVKWLDVEYSNACFRTGNLHRYKEFALVTRTAEYTYVFARGFSFNYTARASFCPIPVAGQYPTCTCAVHFNGTECSFDGVASRDGIFYYELDCSW